MKVKTVGTFAGPLTELHPVEGRQKASSDFHSFERHFNDLNQAEYEQYIKDMVDKIDRQGKLLAGRADLAELMRYKELIAALLNETVENGYSFRKENVFDHRGRRKVYATVIKINQKLEELTQAVLKQNADQIDIMSRVDEIRGLIIDVLL